jgi:hypothetical protein
VSNEFPTFDVDVSATSADFIAAYVRSRSVWDELARSSRRLGCRRQRVHPEAIQRLEIWLPPLSDQTAAVSRLKGLASIPDESRRVKGVLQGLEASLRDQAFLGCTPGDSVEAAQGLSPNFA